MKVLAHTVFTAGHVQPFTAILLELQQRGFDVELVVNTSSADCPREIAGIRVSRVAWREPQRIHPNHGSGVAESAWRENLMRSGEPVARVLESLIANRQPDFLLIDPILWGAMVAAEASGRPWASLAHNPLMIRGTGLDARGPGLRPVHGPIGRLRDRFVDWGLRMRMQSALEMLNASRAARGVRLLSDFRERYLTPPLIIATTAEPFEYPRRDWPSSLVFVGPLIWEPKTHAPEWLERLDGRPLVLVAGSSVPEYGAQDNWVRVILSALASEPIRVLATLPTRNDQTLTSGNALVVPFAPHVPVLGRSSCVVCHGGFGITAKAIAAGVPVLAVPDALDRYEVARRVEFARAGAMLPATRAGIPRLRRAYHTTLRCKTGAQRIAEAFRAAGGAKRAADAVQTLIASYPRSSRSADLICAR